VLPFLGLDEVVSFTDFHECGIVIPASDLLRGFLCEYEVQLQHLPRNKVSQLAGFVVVCEAFLGIDPNKDVFWRIFEVKTHKVHSSDGGMLAPMDGMNI
jgi:hypothetical protein